MVRAFPDELVFAFSDPCARSVEIHGHGPDGVIRAWAMDRGQDGSWHARVRLDLPWFDFRYLVDGRFWALDGGVRTVISELGGACCNRLDLAVR